MEGQTHTAHSDIYIDGFWFFLESLITHNTRPVSEVSWAPGGHSDCSDSSDYILEQDFSIISIARTTLS